MKIKVCSIWSCLKSFRNFEPISATLSQVEITQCWIWINFFWTFLLLSYKIFEPLLFWEFLDLIIFHTIFELKYFVFLYFANNFGLDVNSMSLIFDFMYCSLSAHLQHLSFNSHFQPFFNLFFYCDFIDCIPIAFESFY